LWPYSRGLYPKQFLPLVTEQTMFQETVSRLSSISQATPPLVICNDEHRFMVAEQLRQSQVDAAGILLEPEGRNTAPAVALAALQARLTADDPLLLILPADHVIKDVEVFATQVEKACAAAEAGALVTFGIVPTHPETGYGYIKAGAEKTIPEVQAVERFVEKPDYDTACEYLDSGDYFWNSGMFLFKASRYLEELDKFAPEMLAATRRAIEGAETDLDFIRIDKEAFAASPEDSIDYAVMEKTGDAVVIPLDAGWNDVGSWSALWDVSDKDDTGNAIKGDVLLHDTSNSFIQSQYKLVAAVGVRDLVIVETDDAVMVSPRDRVQEVKAIVKQLKEQGRSEAVVHRKVYRPWGYYDSVDQGDRHQVKRIVVNPGARLSLQMHHHRAEHWIVVQGTALVTKGEEQQMISENESTYIPLGTVHCLENPGVIPLEMVEVQSGSYLGEDDIVRFEDRYGRS